MRLFNPLEMQCLYRARKSAVVEAEEIAVAAGMMGSGEDRYRQRQPRRASWTRFQWYSEEQVADAAL
jgi:hypothetical protein